MSITKGDSWGPDPIAWRDTRQIKRVVGVPHTELHLKS